MSLKHDLLLAIAPPAASLLLKLVGGTVRIDAPKIDFAPNPESGKGAIIVGWHSRLLYHARECRQNRPEQVAR